MFVEILGRNAEYDGGKVTEFSARSTKLSQTCTCDNTKEESTQKLMACMLKMWGQNSIRSIFRVSGTVRR